MSINERSIDDILSRKEYVTTAMNHLNLVYDYAGQLMRGNQGDIDTAISGLDGLNEIADELGIDRVCDVNSESTKQAIIDYAKGRLDNDKYGKSD